MNINEDIIKNVINVDTSINNKSRVNFIKGKNLYNPSYRANDGTIKSSGGTVTESNGVFTMAASAKDSYVWEVTVQGSSYSNDRGELYEFKKDSYTISLSNTAFNNNFITYYNANKISLGYNNFGNSTFTINKSDKTGAKYFTIRFGRSNATPGTTYSTTIQLEEGNQATTYEPYIIPSIVVDGEEIYSKQTDNNTTYTLSKSGSTITLTGSDGTTTSVTDDNTTYSVNNGTLTIKQNGTSMGTFSANQSTNKTIELANTTYSNATTSASGLMSSSDKTKLNNVLRPYSLYSSNGSTVNITLSETSANFSYMEIYFKSTQSYPNDNYQCTKVSSPNGKYVNLNDFWISGNMEFHFAQLYINGTTISRVENHNIFMDGSSFNHTTNKVLSIVKVVGYK